MSLDTRSQKPEAKPENKLAKKTESFAETALRLGGASHDEAHRTGVVDHADDEVEAMFSAEYQTVNSPVHRAVWAKQIETSGFEVTPMTQNESVSRVVSQSLEVVRKHRDNGTLLGDDGKIAASVLAELGSVGYWGLLVDTEYGGSGATMRQFAEMITQMATIDPTIAGLASVHGCIGAVDPVRSFGSEEQKRRFLPKLADGRRLSAFALTEPCAGSDMTALRTNAVLDDDEYVVNGEKLFITNVTPGRTIGLVCKIDGEPSVLIVDLPYCTDEHFQIKKYGIYALRHSHNVGLVFRDFRVPAANLLTPVQGDGLTIAYHGLNLGRVALCANAAGAMRMMLAEMLPWGKFRHTYGKPIDKRELVRRRIGRMAGLIVACDALTAWGAGLLDQGYRGEMECIVAKIFGSEAQKEAAIELLMKTHGGRSFLHGHLFGDNVHDFLAPCIYEGEGEMLGMAFLKSLVKHHGKNFFEPIGRTLGSMGTTKLNPINPKHVWALKGPLTRYSAWYTKQKLASAKWTPVSIRSGAASNERLSEHTQFAQRFLSRSGMTISRNMVKYQLTLADRQCRMSAMSSDVQNAVVMLVTSLYAKGSKDIVTQAAADAVCRELRRRLTGEAPSDEDFRQVTELGSVIVEKGWTEIDNITAGKIMMPYESSN